MNWSAMTPTQILGNGLDDFEEGTVSPWEQKFYDPLIADDTYLTDPSYNGLQDHYKLRSGCYNNYLGF